jgi:hypothetical protein
MRRHTGSDPQVCRPPGRARSACSPWRQRGHPQREYGRMSMRRFTRLTNAFSKKVENHAAAVALYAMHYNFCRVHQTLRVTPAMAAGLTDRVWSLPELVGLLDCE